MDVLVTGANGTVGTAIRDQLGDDDRYEFTWLDVQDHPEYDDTLIADTTDREGLREAMAGQDAVVHLAMSDFLGNPGVEDLEWTEGFGDDCTEICHVYELANEAGVDSVLYASSNHAVGMYEKRNQPEVYEPDFDLQVDHTVRQRADSRYGVVKVFGEAMGNLAAEAHGLSVYSLRICSIRDPEYDHPYGDAERGVDEGRFDRGSDEYEEQVARMNGMWQSRRDFAQMVDLCLRDDSVEFDVFYGRSEGERGWYDIEHAKEVLGYEPQDDADEWDGPPS